MTPKTILEFYGNDPKRWTQGFFARSAIGDPTGTHGEAACCWCLSGACDRVYAIGDVVRANAVWGKLKKVIIAKYGCDEGVSYWNDLPSTTFADVLEVVREAGV